MRDTDHPRGSRFADSVLAKGGLLRTRSGVNPWIKLLQEILDYGLSPTASDTLHTVRAHPGKASGFFNGPQIGGVACVFATRAYGLVSRYLGGFCG